MGSPRKRDNNEDLAEVGRRLASWRDDLIAQGVDPADLAIPLYPGRRGCSGRAHR